MLPQRGWSKDAGAGGAAGGKVVVVVVVWAGGGCASRPCGKMAMGSGESSSLLSISADSYLASRTSQQHAAPCE